MAYSKGERESFECQDCGVPQVYAELDTDQSNNLTCRSCTLQYEVTEASCRHCAGKPDHVKKITDLTKRVHRSDTSVHLAGARYTRAA